MQTRISHWHKAPFTRLLPPFMTGIMVQWYLVPPVEFILTAFIILSLLVVLHFFLPLHYKFKMRILSGTCIFSLLISGGALVAWKNLPTLKLINDKSFQHPQIFRVVVTEPPVQKTNSVKLIATIQNMKGNEKAILYLQKSQASLALEYGSVLLFAKKPEAVKNSGNPGSFDYKRYCLFNGISYQCYLRDEEYLIASWKQVTGFKNFIYSCTEWVIGVIKKFIPSQKEQGLAEALLIGYKNDLDKDLIQAYSNTGVIHVIAISGLHLGLIYGILAALTRPFKKYKKLKWFRLSIVISGLWIFSIMAGAQPSILRSAFMFTCIALAEGLSRKTSIYNSLAFSAFLVLCYNPFWLWDAGFQLSYAAVISIIAFYKPLYNCLYFKNRLINLIWQLSAVTLSAQLLTLPVSIFHFHQFPLLFYFTNMVAVPVSSLILIGEIILCAISFVPPLALILGDILQWLIQFMNYYVERFNGIRIAVLDHLYINLFQSIALTLAIISISLWMMNKNLKLLWSGLTGLLFFLSARSISFYHTGHQKLLLIYNVPKLKAAEVITGNQAVFLGDPEVVRNKTIFNFNLYPSHVQNRLRLVDSIRPFQSFIVKNFRIRVVDGHIHEEKNNNPDILIITGKKRLEIRPLLNVQPAFIVIDASVPAWKLKKIRSDLDALEIIYHDVSEKGAFLMKL